MEYFEDTVSDFLAGTVSITRIYHRGLGSDLLTCSGELLWKIHGPDNMLMKVGINLFRNTG
jgi:hypothetical protein